MGFFRPKMPDAPPPPPPPVIEDTAAQKQQYEDQLRARRGRASSILTQGNAGTPQTASKTLLGG